MKKLLPILTLALLLLCGCTNQATGEAQSEVPENPTNAREVAPDYTYLRNDVDGLNFVYEEDEDLYGLYVSGISQEQYQEYMDKLDLMTSSASMTEMSFSSTTAVSTALLSCMMTSI